MNHDFVGTPKQDRGYNMQMYSGSPFWALDPRPEDVHIEDIAHSLSNICRYGGHCSRFYSVAQHSVLVAEQASKEQKLVALLHDATEAYIGDVPRPVKNGIPQFKEIENKLWTAVALKFNLPLEIPEEIKIIDNRMLATEKQQLLKDSSRVDWGTLPEPYDIQLDLWGPPVAKRFFMETFETLTKE